MKSSKTIFIGRNCHLMSPHRQAGAVLIVSLLMLLIMTLLGITAMNSTTLEEKMAGNMRDRNTAMQASEAALKAAEAALDALTNKPNEVTSCHAASCAWVRGSVPDLANQSASWWASNGVEYGSAGVVDIAGVATDPRVVVEVQADLPDTFDDGQGTSTGVKFYRVTARATGATDDAQVILQTTHNKLINE